MGLSDGVRVNSSRRRLTSDNSFRGRPRLGGRRVSGDDMACPIAAADVRGDELVDIATPIIDAATNPDVGTSVAKLALAVECAQRAAPIIGTLSGGEKVGLGLGHVCSRRDAALRGVALRVAITVGMQKFRSAVICPKSADEISGSFEPGVLAAAKLRHKDIASRDRICRLGISQSESQGTTMPQAAYDLATSHSP